MASVKMSQQLLSAPASTRSAQNTRRMSEEVQCPCPASASLPADRAIALQCLGPYCRHLIFSSSSNLCLFLAVRGIQSLSQEGMWPGCPHAAGAVSEGDSSFWNQFHLLLGFIPAGGVEAAYLCPLPF